MGLLDQWKGKKLEATPLLGGATQALGLLGDAGTMAIRELDKRNKAMARPFTDTSAEAQKQAVAAAMDFVGMAPIGMTAWHASPYSFNKFAPLEKVVGTGEGAQAYGHGFYLAEAPAVAKEYLKLAGKENGMAGQIASRHLQMYKNPDSAIEALQGSLNPNVTGDARKITEEAISLLKNGQANTGYLYKTDIPDEAVARFLDWDKPLSQQWFNVERAKEVAKRNAEYEAMKAEVTPDTDFLSMFVNATEGKIPDPLPYQSLANLQSGLPPRMNELTGKDFYGMLARGMGSDKAAQELQKQGIPGIRYLDQGSRQTNVGTSNFVAFDPEMIRILERNGQPTGLMPWKPGEYGLLK